jgi:hypothetical protein
LKKYYIYRFKDRYDNIIYIGKTKDIYQRISQHFGTGGHLTHACYDDVVSIEFATLNSCIDMNIYEMYLIDTIRPKFNTEFMYENQKCSLKLEDLEFKPYDRLLRVERRKKNVITKKVFANSAYDLTNDTENYNTLRYNVIHPKGKVILTKRDFCIFKFIVENSGATSSDIAYKFFDNKIRPCQHRLKKLKDIGFISSHRADILSEMEYFINTNNLQLYKKAVSKIV